MIVGLPALNLISIKPKVFASLLIIPGKVLSLRVRSNNSNIHHCPRTGSYVFQYAEQCRQWMSFVKHNELVMGWSCYRFIPLIISGGHKVHRLFQGLDLVEALGISCDFCYSRASQEDCYCVGSLTYLMAKKTDNSMFRIEVINNV